MAANSFVAGVLSRRAGYSRLRTDDWLKGFLENRPVQRLYCLGVLLQLVSLQVCAVLLILAPLPADLLFFYLLTFPLEEGEAYIQSNLPR